MQFDLFDATQNSILSSGKYADFKKALIDSDCTRCALSAHRTQLVVDRGNPDAGALFVGEAPGKNEDLQGKAFVGRAGRLLDEMMKELGFDTNRDSLIANVVKCRPPENRTPLPVEAEICMPYLQKQINLVQPKLIGLLGATALKYLIPEKKFFLMEREAGQFFEHVSYPGSHLMVLYHPAYILRDPRKKPLMGQHLKKFVEFWRAHCLHNETVMKGSAA